MLCSLFLDDTEVIRESLKEDFSEKPVHQLWDLLEKTISFKYCESKTSDEILDEVYKLTSHQDKRVSHIFQNIFNKAKELYLQKHKEATVTIEVAVSELWKPACDEFNEGLKCLCNDLKLPLIKVDYIFKGLSSQTELKDQLLLWCEAVGEANVEWIDDAAQKILEYQELRRYSYTARTLMLLKEKLELIGDFDAVQALLSKEEVILRYYLIYVITLCRQQLKKLLH